MYLNMAFFYKILQISYLLFSIDFERVKQSFFDTTSFYITTYATVHTCFPLSIASRSPSPNCSLAAFNCWYTPSS